MKNTIIVTTNFGEKKYTKIATIDPMKFNDSLVFVEWMRKHHPRYVFGYLLLKSHDENDCWKPFDVYVPLLKDFEFGATPTEIKMFKESFDGVYNGKI